MRRLYIATILCALLMGCTQDDWKELIMQEVTICGKSIQGDDFSSRGNATTTLADNSQISFFSQYPLEAKGEILTLHQNIWEGSHNLTWKEGATSVDVKAYCPPLPQSSGLLYNTDGQLCDMLLAKGNYPSRKPICLKFGHLFAQLNFEVDTETNERLDSVIIFPHVLLTNVDPYLATLNTTYISSESSPEMRKVTFNAHPNGIYSIILPPHDSAAVTILLKMNDGRTLHKKLANIRCLEGHTYHCRLKEKDNQIGIYTAEDFIAFTHLINNKPYKNRSLKEFGITQNGHTTYFLKKNIQFTESDKKGIMQIGCKMNENEDFGFKDTFDGQKHFLEGLEIPTRDYQFGGLFQRVKSSGCIKNLIIRRVRLGKSSNHHSDAILCGENFGNIENCQLENITVIIDQQDKGGFVVKNNGAIVNCSIDQLHLIINSYNENQATNFGGVSLFNAKNTLILNCKTDNLDCELKQNLNGIIAGICPSNNGTIANCVTDHCDHAYYPLCRTNYGQLSHAYYPAELKEKTIKHMPGAQKLFVYRFKDTFDFRQRMINYLNQWIEDTGQQEYSQFTFLHWKLIEQSIITFDSH